MRWNCKSEINVDHQVLILKLFIERLSILLVYELTQTITIHNIPMVQKLIFMVWCIVLEYVVDCLKNIN